MDCDGRSKRPCQRPRSRGGTPHQAILLDDKHFLNRELYGDAAAGIIGGNTGLRKVGSFREDIVAVR